MSFITEQEAIERVAGFNALSDGDKADFLEKSEAYLLARNVKPYEDITTVPKALKTASFEVIKGIMKGDLYQGQEPALKRKRVKAEVESEKEYQDGSVKLNATEQYILDLIKPYCKRRSVIYIRKI
ncbi:hypothetical protein BFR80_013990 [Acinetobacter pittii]|jgi:hypothetical protein|uniref:hypothetical protein n=1 Tax=Acinetobacter calcoaceticus/baumannii complex TaxID=909768 RepID=UPI00070F5AA8|nr:MULTISPECIES: hypothetical protein [Acinetobacter calcoaceticus/baumannii complex]KQF50350.1 hypothetical protein APC05_10810 [Acinetobacter pittii]KQF52367.1 hypothetical protein APC05_24420 [Acinetobacter pittii]MCK0925189.1 hypothetical protein [Acinetobacter pittii]OTK27728.1 hypothetical protein B9X43_08190 [Acinetobacter baumannii]